MAKKPKGTGETEWPVNSVFPSTFRPLGHALEQRGSRESPKPICCRRCGGSWSGPLGPSEPCTANPMVDAG